MLHNIYITALVNKVFCLVKQSEVIVLEQKLGQYGKVT